jgi:predicted DNA-binding transcriptional regulator YafY
MSAAERRWTLLKLLCKRRYDKIANLATEFGVSEKTIRRDISILSITEPIYTVSGRYGGGVYVVEGYYFDCNYFNENQILLIKSIIEKRVKSNPIDISDNELSELNSLLNEYTKPQKSIKGAK